MDAVVARVLAPALVAMALVVLVTTNAVASDCTAGTAPSGHVLQVEIECESPSGSQTQEQEDAEPYYTDYEWKVPCSDIVLPCPAELQQCPNGTELMVLLGLHNAEWTGITADCRAPNSPTITPASVATAFQRLPLPALRSIAQPGDKTLVNFDTVFYVEAETLDRDVTLLGQQVDLTITPSRFRWTYGDGTSEVTTIPGTAYPAKSLTHRYTTAHVTVRHQVEITWTATWRVNGGPWQDVPGSVTITGPSTALRVSEATPLLSSGDR